jgi:hypothetical protein
MPLCLERTKNIVPFLFFCQARAVGQFQLWRTPHYDGGMVSSYWRRVRQRAWQDTLYSASLDSQSRVTWRLLVAVGAILLIAYVGAPADLKSRALTALATTGAFAIAFTAFFVWHFAAAPAKMDTESRDTIDGLNRQLEDREKLKCARAALWILREEGVKLRNDGKFTRIINSWTEQFNAWHAKVLEQAEILSVDLRHSLEPIDKISHESNETVAVNDPFHQKRVSVMSEMLARLYRYLDKSGN